VSPSNLFRGTIAAGHQRRCTPCRRSSTARSRDGGPMALHWLPVEARIQYKLCLLVHLAPARKAPTYITSLLQPITACLRSMVLRSATDDELFTPCTIEAKIRRKGFSHIDTKSLELSTPRRQTGSLHKQF